MKRSNRLILLVGFLMAAVAFVGVVVLLQSPATPNGATAVPTDGPVPIELIRAGMLNLPLARNTKAAWRFYNL